MSSLVGTTLPRDPASELTLPDLRNLRRLAGFMIPTAADYAVPGADDERIFTDIVRSLGRDQGHVCKALAMLRDLAGEDFAALPDTEAEATAMALLAREGAEVVALGRAVLQCYYRDDRVVRSLGLEPSPPFPKGHALAQGDWSLLDAVRGRPRMWRDLDGKGG
jgi:hypothetical protein